METRRTTVGCSVTDDTYDQVLREAARRGITVSELIRYCVEEGLNNPRPEELRRLTDRLSTIEGALQELYTMAIVNWAQVKKEGKKRGAIPKLPWMDGFWDDWKGQLKKKGLVNKETGKAAYEELKERESDAAGWQNDFMTMTNEEEEDLLRSMCTADGNWTDEEEAEYQEKLKKRVEISRKRLPQK